MEILKNVSLKNYTTLKIGGIAKSFYIPKTIEEVKKIVEENKEVLILGGGSNLLINDKKEFEKILYLGKFENNLIKQLDNNKFYVSSSVKLSKLISTINNFGYGGIEYLCTVPATVGGAIVMNAGRGKQYNKQISDFILEVKVLENGIEKILKKDECDFIYRGSKFKKNSTYIILGVVFEFLKQDLETSIQAKKERIEISNKYLDAKNFSAGSVFKISNGLILFIVRKIGIGWSNGIKFSNKTNNWLNNHGQGTYEQACILIKIVKIIHKLTLRKIELEYIVWD